MKRALFVKGLLAIMLLALLAVPGCSKKEEPKSAAPGVSKEAYDATKAYTQEQMQAFRQATETKFAQYGKDIDQLQAKAEKLQGDAKVKAEQQLTALRQKRDAVAEKLKELSSASAGAWDQVKSGVNAAMEDLGKAYQKAAAEFGKL